MRATRSDLLECIGRLGLARALGLDRVLAVGDKLAGLIATLPGFGQWHVWIDPKGERALMAVQVEFQPPVLAAGGVYQQV